MDTFSPIYETASLPWAWTALAGGKIAMLPAHWQRHPGNPVLPSGMNCRPVLQDDGTVRVWFGRRGREGGICHFTVHPDKPWELLGEPVGPVIPTGPAGACDDDWVLCPEPVRIAAGHWRMYYAAKRRGDFFKQSWSLACAESHDDGRTWVKHPGNPIFGVGTAEWESGAVGFASVAHDAAGWRMWYLGTNQESNAVKQVGYATSADGLHWERYPGNPVLPVNPENHWEKGAIAVPRVIRDEGVWRVWYCCYPQNDTYAIGCAESADGIQWLRSPHNPVLQPAGGNAWDSGTTGYPGVIRVGDRYLMWYSGNGYGASGIGLATAAAPRGAWQWREGDAPTPDTGWSPWRRLAAGSPPSQRFVQLAAVAD